jgi:hypothetical protein
MHSVTGNVTRVKKRPDICLVYEPQQGPSGENPASVWHDAASQLLQPFKKVRVESATDEIWVVEDPSV